MAALGTVAACGSSGEGLPNTAGNPNTFPVEAVLAKAYSGPIAFTMHADGQEDRWRITVNRALLGTTFIPRGSRQTSAGEIRLTENGRPSGAMDEQYFYSLGPWRLHGWMETQYFSNGAFTYSIAVDSFSPPPVTARIGESGALFSATRSYPADQRIASSTLNASWSVESNLMDGDDTASICLRFLESPAAGIVVGGDVAYYRTSRAGEILGMTYESRSMNRLPPSGLTYR